MLLRSYQEEAVASLFHYFSTKSGNPIVAMPTGTGKSLVIARFVYEAMTRFPMQSRFMIATHVKELIQQNSRTLVKAWQGAPVGVYSAGLSMRDTAMPIIFGGVKSIVNNLPAFGHRDIMIIDEGHLVSPKAGTSYQKVIEHFLKVNPYFKVVMFTATPYRMGQGLLTDEVEKGKAIATDICFDITGIDAFNRLVYEGYLSPLISFRRDIGIDLSNVGVSNGEYNQQALQGALDKTEITQRALQHCVNEASDRRSWLIFASGVEHSEHIATMLSRFGISAAAVHSEMTAADRRARIEAFKRGHLRCLVNMNVLTTGFDFPPIDFIAMLRPTLSPGLWVQMLGRGTRPWLNGGWIEIDEKTQIWVPGGKQNCLVLDFAGNARRLGPINDPKIPQRKRKGPGGLPPVKDCEFRLPSGNICGCENHISARYCISCGNEFTFEPKIFQSPATDVVMASDTPIVEWFDVERVFYMKHKTRTKGEDVLKASYHCRGLHQFDEMVWFGDHKMAGKGKRWWQMRHASEVPDNVDDALKYMHELKQPSRIRVWTNCKYPQILNVEFNQWQQSEPNLGKILDTHSSDGYEINLNAWT